MPVMKLSPGGEFGLVFRFQSLLSVPPGAPAVEIIAYIRRADDSHVSPRFVERESIAQIF